MKSLAEELRSRKKAAYQKLKTRFVKNLETGKITEKTNRDKYRLVNKLKQIERQLGIRSTVKLRHWAMALAFGLITVTASAQSPTVPFRSTKLLSESVVGERMLYADFDGDGDTDVLSLVYIGDHTIFFNDGNGNLGNRTVIEPANQKLGGAFTGDFDGDGDQDIMIVEEYGNYDHLRLLSNDGDGTSFTSSQAYYRSSYSILNASPIDLDVDGNLDFIVKFEDNLGSPEFQNLLNDGAGNFTLNTPAFSIALNDDIYTGDFDADGDDDILAINNLLGITFFRNDSTLMFSQTVYSAPGPPSPNNLTIGIGDMDDDGDPDIVASYDYTVYRMSLFTNDGSGSFSQEIYGSARTYQPGNIRIIDVDGDLNVDVLADYNGEERVFNNSGTDFTLTGQVFSGKLGAFDALIPGDLDGDGDDDILGAGYYELALFKNSAGTFTLYRDDFINPIFGEQSAIGDVDNDGDLDIVTNRLSQVLHNDGLGNFSLLQTLSHSNGLLSGDVSLGDINGDGYLDVVFTGEELNQPDGGLIQVGLNDQTGNMVLQPLDTLSGSGEIFYSALADIDGDLTFELVVFDYSTGPPTWRYFDIDGAGNIGSPSSSDNSYSLYGFDNGAVGDFDDDGDTDVLLGGYQAELFKAESASLLEYSSLVSLSGGFDSKGVDYGDLDGDGDPDAVFSNDIDNSSGYYLQNFILRNDSSASIFTEETSFFSANPTKDVAVADFDSDGLGDVFFASYPNEDELFLNDGTTGFTFTKDTSSTVSSSYSVNKGDFDGDGDMDIFSVKGDRSSYILFNDFFAAPIFDDVTFSVAENPPTGSPIDTLRATDVNGDPLTFSILSGDTGGAFAISNDSILVVNDSAQFDFESTTSFALVVQASDGALIDSATVTVNITNIDEAPPLADGAFSISENPFSGVLITTLSATDPEGLAVTYGIESGNGSGAFALDANTGDLTVADSTRFDFETTTQFILEVTALAGTIADTAQITIDVSDLDEAPSLADGTFNVAENPNNGTLITSLSATDPEGAVVTYSITSGNATNAFTINTSTGEILVADSTQFNYEVNTQFVLGVEATDGTNPDPATVTVNITDIDEAVDFPDFTFPINENSAAGTVVGTVSAIDPDGLALTYSIISGNGLGAFALNSTSGEITVADSAQVDFEVNPQFVLGIEATDGTLPDTATVTIDVVDVVESTIPVVDDQVLSVSENPVNGTIVGPIVATDPLGLPLTLSIASSTAPGTFTINGSNELVVADSAALDFESIQTVTLTVEATNGSDTGSGTVTVNLIDVNESPLATNKTFRVDQDAANGTVVGVVPATDPEGDLLTFVIESGDPGGAFAIQQNTGEITVLDSTQLDYETQADYVLDVSVSDAEFTDNATVQVRVTTLARDQETLLALYDATGGENWTNKTNWSANNSLADTQWDGITVTAGRVTAVELPGNGLDGDVPESFADLTGLTTIDLSGNEITGFPDVSFFPDLTNLNLENNRLGIADLLANAQGTFTYDYEPQKAFGIADQDTIPAGSDYSLSFPELNGYSATYTWALEGANVGTGETYSITNADFSQMGAYTLSVSQIAGLDGLTITTEPFSVYAETDVFGQVFADDQGTPLTAGQVNIYRIFDGPFELTDSATVDATTGEYVIDEVVLGSFILLVQNDVDAFPDVLQTYYISTNDWVEADTLFLLEQAQGIDIFMQEKPVPEKDPTGGELVGLVETNFTEEGEGDGRIEARRKVKKAGCSLRRRTRSGGGRTGQDDEYELFAYVESNDEGEFSFSEIPPGEYLINIQYPGVPMDTTSQIKFTISDDFENQTFQLNATITEEGIKVNIDEILGVEKPYVKNLTLYPNPTRGKMIADYTVYRRISDLKMQILDLKGLKLQEVKLNPHMGTHRIDVDMVNLDSGVYFLVLTDEAETFRYVVKIGKK